MRRGVRALVAAVAAALVLAGCQSPEEKRQDRAEGALAAARVYVAAIADRDPAAADAMTDGEGLQNALGSGVDVRNALTSAEQAIEDPWVSLVATSSSTEHALRHEYVVAVSYTVRGLAGGANIRMGIDRDADPSDVSRWRVVDPLVEETTVYARQDSVPRARFGDVEVEATVTSNVSVRGYPGGYTWQPATPIKGVDPRWVALGAADAVRWWESLPILEVEED